MTDDQERRAFAVPLCKRACSISLRQLSIVMYKSVSVKKRFRKCLDKPVIGVL